MKRLVFLLICLSLVAGCSHRSGKYRDGRFTSKDTAYVLGSLPDGWKVDAGEPADVSFASDDFDATIYVDNSCRRYSDASLNTLANHLFYGFDDIEVFSQEIFELDGREALRRIATARLDGVLLRVGVTVVKKDTCIFDLMLISPKDTFDYAFSDYEGLLDGFHVERCP